MGYGGWKLGDGIRGLTVKEDVVGLWAEEGPACDAVSTVPPRREGCWGGGRGRGIVESVAVEVVVMQQFLRESEVCTGS